MTYLTIMKKRSWLTIMSALLAFAFGLASCDKDSPDNPDDVTDQPQTPPDGEENPPSNEEERPDLSKVLPGDWVAFDGEAWYSVTFGTQKGSSSRNPLTLMSSETVCPMTDFRISMGSYLTFEDSSLVSGMLDSGSNTPSETSFEMQDWSDYEFKANIKTSTQTLSDQVYRKVIRSISAPLGYQEELKEWRYNNNKLNFKSVKSLQPSVIEVESGNTVRTKSYGTGYLLAESDKGNVLIEVICTPLETIPYRFEDMLGKVAYTVESTPSGEVSNRNPEIAPLYEEYPGISKISYTTSDLHTMGYVEIINVVFSDEMSSLAIWKLLNASYSFSGFVGDKNGTEAIFSGNDRKIHWNIATSTITYMAY